MSYGYVNLLHDSSSGQILDLGCGFDDYVCYYSGPRMYGIFAR